jgi:hypothetical protein
MHRKFESSWPFKDWEQPPALKRNVMAKGRSSHRVLTGEMGLQFCEPSDRKQSISKPRVQKGSKEVGKVGRDGALAGANVLAITGGLATGALTFTGELTGELTGGSNLVGKFVGIETLVGKNVGSGRPASNA